MKTDIRKLKKELSKLTSIEGLKEELERISAELKKYDIHLKISPQAKARFEYLHARFQDLQTRLLKLQKQIDSEVHKVSQLLAEARAEAKKRLREYGFGSKKKTSKKKTSSKKSASQRKSAKSAK